MSQFNCKFWNESTLINELLLRTTLLFFALFVSCITYAEHEDVQQNIKSSPKRGVLRIIEPGIFDYQANDYIVRMRAWGVQFPSRGQPGYNEGITFSENILLEQNVTLLLKEEFDQNNIKVVEVFIGNENKNFSKISIEKGIGWHNESETNRKGEFLIAQLKAKRQGVGIWESGGIYYGKEPQMEVPSPILRSMIQQSPFTSSINFWVTSFGKIHRPGCSFYERGKGELSRRPTGTDCRICGGTNWPEK